MRLREKQFKKQMDSKRKIEGDGFSTVKETHKTSVKGKCNDGARCCAGTPCFFCSISCNFSKCFTAISRSALRTWDLLFLALKCDSRKNPTSKVSKTQKKKMFCYPTQYHLSMQGDCNHCHRKGRKQFLFIFKD